MNVEHIFLKKLTRDINGVVKAEQTDDDSVFVELDEYVVTRELDRHFRSFFETYGPAVNSYNPAVASKIGVWVSGFFGSGKSHFIKILSYLLENREVVKDGQSRRAIEFFKDKIDDAMLYSDIHSAVSKPTDVILFNIDSQANTDDQDNAILKVFLKVFNNRAGYCADFPHIAHLERELDKRSQYLPFKSKFEELTGSSWEDQRDAYDFYRDEMIEALSVATSQSSESTRQWVEQIENNFPLSINNFCKWVKEYLDRKSDHNLLFLVDEVGQFIGKNTQMMLQLQTITEDLGRACNGRAWVVVTSQADIDAAIGQLSAVGAQDFSKIQGRFYTRLQLSSSNTSEVIQRRLLEKTEPAIEALTELFIEKGDILRNQLTFDKTTTASLSGYSDAVSLVDNYPFVPYHYPLVQKVFESIRTKGATGKHLAMGERSLLDAFQSAAKQIKDESIGRLIPFYCFFDPIESFLEPAVKRTIDQACELDSISDFDGKVLKTLFLIRYVDVVKSTLENLVTLCIDRIDADKIALKAALDDSLNRLERQLLIARNGDEFVFLTNEEKEIENEIRHTEVEPSELTNELSRIIFDDILRRQRTYRYPGNKQDFDVSRFCNGHPKDGSSLEDLVVKVVSPLDPVFENSSDQQWMQQTLEEGGSVLVKLQESSRLFGHKGVSGDLQTYIQTDRFLKINSGQRPEQEHILREKAMENNERAKRLRHDFEALFGESEVFAIGTRLNPKSSTPSVMLEDAYRYVVENTFSKINLIRPSAGGEPKRELNAILVADDLAQLGLDLDAQECNPEATREIEQIIAMKVERSEPVLLRDLLTRFTRRPYGWQEDEVLILIARLGLAGKISFTLNNADLSLKNAYDPFTSVRKRGDIRVQKVRQHDDRQIRKAAKLTKDLFSKTFTGTAEKELAELIQRELLRWNEELKRFQSKAQTGQYPGKREIDQGLVLVAGILEQPNSFALIERLLADGDQLDSFSEDYEDLDDFYNSQFGIWQQLKSALDTFEPNSHVLEKDPQASQALQELRSIYNSEAPYGKLRNVASLIETVRSVNADLLEKRRSVVLTEVQQLIVSVTEQLSGLPTDLKNQALYPLQQCSKRIEQTNSLHALNSELHEASNQEDEAIEILNRYAEEQRAKAEAPVVAPVADKKDPVTGYEVREAPPVAKPIPVTKKVIIVSPSELLGKAGGAAYLENASDVDDYLNKLRDRLMTVVAAGERVRIK